MVISGHWVNNLDPILLHIHGDFGIRFYGMAYVLSFLAGMGLLRLMRVRKVSPFNAEQEATAILAWVLGVLIGGRLGYVLLYAFPRIWQDPLMIFRVWEGGMSSHGGFAGVIIATAWLSLRFRLPFLRLSDVLCLLTPPGFFLVRIANFINGELWGKISTSPWAVIFPLSAPPGTPLDQIQPRHPSQLYEAAFEGLILLAYTQWRFWRTPARTRPGRMSGEFLILYALLRILGEQFREPDAGLILGMSRGIFYSLFLLALGVLFLWYSFTRRETGR